MVSELGICMFDGESDDEDMIVPSKLRTHRNLRGTLSVAHVATIWFGIRFQCNEIPLSVCVFPQLQVHLYNLFWKRCAQKPRLWSCGLAIPLRNCDGFGIVEAQQKQMAIDIIVGGTEETRRDCYALLQLLKEETLLKLETFSPGSDISELILSSRELSSLDWNQSTSVPEITYEKWDVEETMESQVLIRPRGVMEAPENAHDLMVIPANHVRLMTTERHDRFCYEMNRSHLPDWEHAKWHDLARCLDMPPHNMPLKDEANPTGYILRWWGQHSGQNTTDRLLAAVQAIGQREAAAILEKEQPALGPTIFPTEWEPNTKPDTLGNSASLTEDDGGGEQPVTREVDLSTLLEIARCFNDMFDCEQLAVFLRISQASDTITFLRASNPHISPHQAAYEVLKRWREEKGSDATGEVLYRVLREKLKMSGGVVSRFERDSLPAESTEES